MEADNFSAATKKLEKELSNMKRPDIRLRRVLREMENMNFESRPFRIAP